jgi:hypothetical protein
MLYRLFLNTVVTNVPECKRLQSSFARTVRRDLRVDYDLSFIELGMEI